MEKIYTAKNVTSNTIWQLASKISCGIMGFSIAVSVARYLNVANFGIYTFVIFFTGILRGLVDLAMDPVIVQNISVDRNNEKVFLGNMLILKFLLAIFAALIAVIVINLMNYPSSTRMLIYFSTLIFFATAIISAGVALKTYLKMPLYAISEIISASFLLIWTLLLIYFKKDLAQLVIAWISAEVLKSLLVFFFSRRLVRPDFEFRLDIMRAIIKKSLPVGVAAILISGYYNIDMIFLSKIKGDYSLGLYGAANKFLTFLIFIPFAMMVSFFPIMSKKYMKNKDNFKTMLQRIFELILFLALPIAIAVTILSKKIIFLLYGGNFIQASGVLQIVIWTTAILFFERFATFSLFAINRQVVFLYYSTIGLTINILLNLVLIPRFDFNGAATAALITQLVVVLICFYFLYRYERFKPSFKFIPRILLINILFALLVFWLKDLNLFLLATIGMSVYLLLGYYANCIDFKNLKNTFSLE